MRVRYRRRALSDIESIHDYIKNRNPRAATEVVARIRAAAERLGTWPRLGHSSRVPGTNEWWSSVYLMSLFMRLMTEPTK